MKNFEELEQFINSHIDNWKELLKKDPYNLQSITQCSYNNNWYVLVYNLYDSDLMNPIVRQCRGTIVEVTDKCRVICAPYLKFFTYGQHEADTIDWTTAKIREKIDGQLIKCFKYNGQIYWATNGSLELTVAINNNENTNDPQSYKELLYRAITKNDPEYEASNLVNFNNNIIRRAGFKNNPFFVHTSWMQYIPEGWTLMFELVSPYNRIVVDYPDVELWFHGARDADGNEHEPEDIKELFHLPYNVPKSYDFKNIDEIQKYIETWKGSEQEGVVVCDANYHRVKVKCEDYLKYAYQAELMTKRNYLLSQVLNEKYDDLVNFPEAYKTCLELKDFMNDLTQRLKVLHKKLNSLFEGISKKEIASQIMKDDSIYKNISDLVFKSISYDIESFVSFYINKMVKVPTTCYTQASELYNRIKEFTND